MFSFVIPGFATLDNAVSILQTQAVAAVAALGMTLTAVVGDLDLSVGAVAGLSVTVAAVVMSPPQLSSRVIAIPIETHRSRTCLVFVSPPSLLIFRFTTSIARSALARSSTSRLSMFSSRTKG